ncbi:MAG: tetratricopeptide repeat protein [Flavobacteriales bacterium]|nr:tetratricopeptide repeat protein [Flavobacteriales bacterium]
MKGLLKIGFVLLVIATIPVQLVAQKNTDEQLAAQFYNDKAYDKAVIYYQKLFDKTELPTHYIRLLTCYLELQEYKNAEKLVKRQMKKLPYQLGFHTDLAYVYKASGDELKSKQTNERAIKLLTPDNEQIIGLANGFLKYKETDLAIETYQKGRKLLRGTYPFNFELAEVYNLQGNTEAMLEEYLGLIEYQKSYLQSVQNALQTALNPDDDNEKKSLLKTLLLKRIQKNADETIFSEMLIWVYVQERNFNGAFIQAKALDRRRAESGFRINTLAKLCVDNRDYETAIKCHEYLISKGSDNSYYISSKIELVDVYNLKITSSNAYTPEDLKNLEQIYLTTLNELGRTPSTASLLRGLAHLKAFYLYDTDEAVSLLKEVLGMGTLNPHSQAKAKLELADVYLFIDEVWEASLLYSQVEKAFKHDELGEQAKFKNAKVSFYTGDFGWCKTQLNVLKASTSKLIANDAMQLSILITDNIGIDTNQAPLLIFAKADLLSFQNKHVEAMKMLDSLDKWYPFHTIADDILYKRYQINYKQKKFEEAAQNLETIIEKHGEDILADDALYNLALLNDYQFNNKEKAAELYKKIMFDYQSSIFVVDSRKRYRELRDTLKIIKIENDVLEFKTN